MSVPLFVGLTTVDLSYAVDAYPAEDTKTRARDQFLGAGGPAANAAVACAILTGGARLLTAVGQHPLTALIRDDLRSHGVELVDTTARRTDPPPISSIVVAAGAGTRTVVSLDGSGIEASFDDESAALVQEAPVVLVDGHHIELALGIARVARAAGIPVVLDGGRWKPEHAQLLPLVDIAICSASFAPPDCQDVFGHLHRIGIPAVAVTRGQQPILYSANGVRGEIAVGDVDRADTLGAGDILHGAFCAYHSRGHDVVDALTRAAAVATLSCRFFGTRAWGDRLDELAE
ncbi:sugar/nucleoside kinase (ribokinase family) [Nocardia kruczakiae]|uniref:Sugar/nucleoside kinase (Ribokinase family) n=1 Tax=Nocardia kruczakiae TaxID=261477 RepID=A0ABU1XFE5_9NOCA|nr:PfkB family carbohydrate kinase [Nocardia kruczakiae]MDR7169267.1 sugar/nucleoside kinase (ribokinase family) [Nocardia kruczakiae]